MTSGGGEPRRTSDVSVRFARPGDVPAIVGFIRELAAFERLADQVEAGEAEISSGLFGDHRYAEALLAEIDGRPCGFALFFHTYSTFLGRPGLYLEDLFVSEASRGTGVGRALFAAVAAVARDRACGRLEWAALTWNPARRFYERHGGEPLDDWVTYRLTGDSLRTLADSAPSVGPINRRPDPDRVR